MPDYPAHRLLQDDAARAERQIKLLRGSKAISEHVGLSQRDVLALIKAGDMPGAKIGNKFVVTPEAIEKWLAEKMLRKMLSQ